jgi:hypothetical protein
MATEINDELNFLDWHKPGILPGEYTIQVKHTIVAEGIPADDPGFATPVLSFAVLGERFALAPDEVHAVFPPDGSMGDHSNVLPHVVLRRSTLPWERQTAPNDTSTPWLALLVFHADEIGEATSMSLSDAKNGGFFSDQNIQLERGQTLDDKVMVIDVEKSLLEQIVPNAVELAKLTHVRKRGDTELAVVISKRLPNPNGFSTAHLVSLENRFASGQFKFSDNAKNGDHIRLISLARFRFGCFEPKQSFTSLARALNKPVQDSTGNGSLTLRLPEMETAKAEAREHLAMGSVPLRYRMRNGQTTVSWYHGPLAPAQQSLLAVPMPPVRVADELLRYNSKTGMFDVSYAAAWEIGRLLALQDKKFSVELHHWKQEHAKLGQLAELTNAHPLANIDDPSPDLPLPDPLKTWLDHLSLLEGVPFHYLVPDERMLPLESIRIFWFDWHWIECLLDGAFSIGRHTDAGTARDAAHKITSHITTPHKLVTGVILRSEVVSGWPGLQVDGYNKGQLLETLRPARLSPNVLMCLFDGEITDVTIHQKVETLHFGLELKDGALVKKLRNDQEVKIVLKDKRIFDLDNKELSSFTSAQFAYQMVEKVEEITLKLSY